LKEASESLPLSEIKGPVNWEALEVAYIASGDPEEDRRLAAIAREQGKVVFLRDLPAESDPRFNNPLPKYEAAGTTPILNKNSTKTPFSWYTIQDKIWAATSRKRTRAEIAVNVFGFHLHYL
jgi:hypothetical protein